MQAYVLMAMQAEWPFCDLDAFSFFLVRVEPAVYKLLDNRGLAHRTAPHEDELRFIQRPLAAPHAEVIFENVTGLGWLTLSHMDIIPSRSQHFHWQPRYSISMQIKFLKQFEMSDRLWHGS